MLLQGVLIQKGAAGPVQGDKIMLIFSEINAVGSMVVNVLLPLSGYDSMKIYMLDMFLWAKILMRCMSYVSNLYIQGGAMNRGLLFSGPLPPRSWVSEPQKCHNTIGYGPTSGINIAGGSDEH
jgi:hypothetical protein